MHYSQLKGKAKPIKAFGQAFFKRLAGDGEA